MVGNNEINLHTNINIFRNHSVLKATQEGRWVEERWEAKRR